MRRPLAAAVRARTLRRSERPAQRAPRRVRRLLQRRGLLRGLLEEVKSSVIFMGSYDRLAAIARARADERGRARAPPFSTISPARRT